MNAFSLSISRALPTFATAKRRLARPIKAAVGVKADLWSMRLGVFRIRSVCEMKRST
jgi:hypothetical protein